MQIASASVIHHPRARVYQAYRDRLPEVAAHIPSVAKIETASRDPLPHGVKLHNVWHARAIVPEVAKSFIKPGMLLWDDYAEWDDAACQCTWRLVTRVFTDSVHCAGTTRFIEEDAQHTRVALVGELRISLTNVPVVPRLLRSAVEPQVERFLVALVTPNLLKVNQGLAQFLDQIAP